MKIKYKLALVFIFIILIATLPLSLFIITGEEREKLELINRHGELSSRLLARSTVNILMMNGGDIPTSKVDAREMLSMFSALSESGLVHAECVLVSGKKLLDGLVLARYSPGETSQVTGAALRISPDDMKRLKSGPSSARIRDSARGDFHYEFVSFGAPPGKAPVCLGRLVFSESVILEPLVRMRRTVYLSIGAAILLVGLIALFFSRFISRPIEALTEELEKIEVGDLSLRVTSSGRDETGRLAVTFNHMLKMIELHISGLVEANRELKKLDLLKDEFLANTSHELRTPLNGMIGLAESLLAGAAGPVDGPARHDLSLIVESGRRLTRLVNDILDFSRLKNLDVILEPAPVDLHSVTQLSLSTLRAVIEGKAITARNMIPPGEFIVHGDVTRIQQILMNLLGNAVKFTTEGHICVTAVSDPENKNMIIVTVEDSGIGVPEDKKELIFESFEQGDGSVTRLYGGTGLGLSITKKLVELHGGSIWVDSEPGAGARFSFSLKRSSVSPSTASAEVPPFTPENQLPDIHLHETDSLKTSIPGKQTILIVDDDPVNLRVLINFLAIEGYGIRTASDGKRALDEVRAEPTPDLVLLDVMLPFLSGYDVAREIRKEFENHLLPIIMLTARNKPEDIVTGIESGANDYLTKPVEREELLARVKNLVSLKESVREHGELNLLRRDIDIAHRIQRSLVLREVPPLRGLNIALRYYPMTELGGDFYDIHELSDGSVALLIADVSGHGIPAALISSMFRVVYAFHLAETPEPALLMEKVNFTMNNYTGGQFITACFARLAPDRRSLHYSSAGHWPLLIARADGSVESRGHDGIPFGWDPRTHYDGGSYDLSPGDRIVFYTDGIIESTGDEGAMFGSEGLFRALHSERTGNAEECADAVITALHDWTGRRAGESFCDDVTLIVVDILEV